MAEVRWTDRAEKDLRRLDARQRERVVAAVLDLAGGGHGDVKRLQAIDPPTLRLRVGPWRVLFRLAADRRLLLVLRVRPRGAAYR